MTNSGELLTADMDEPVKTIDPALKRLFVNFLLNHTVQLDTKKGGHVFKGTCNHYLPSSGDSYFMVINYHYYCLMTSNLSLIFII